MHKSSILDSPNPIFRSVYWHLKRVSYTGLIALSQIDTLHCQRLVHNVHIVHTMVGKNASFLAKQHQVVENQAHSLIHC